MKSKRQAPKAAPGRDGGRSSGAAVMRDDERRRRADGRPAVRRPVEAPSRENRPKNARVSGPAREQRALRQGPATAPATTPVPRRGRPKSTSQATSATTAAPATTSSQRLGVIFKVVLDEEDGVRPCYSVTS